MREVEREGRRREKVGIILNNRYVIVTDSLDELETAFSIESDYPA